MHFDLHIPDFFSAEGVPPAEDLAAAETLIARGRRRRIASVSPEAWLFGRFGVERQRDWPVAPYTLLADGGAPERHFWMRADPVHLRVGRDSLVLADGAAFQVSRAESEALVETLNRHFGQTMLFYPMRPARWYVRLEKAPDMQTTPAAAARGLAIDETLPSGPDAMRFHALMNEAQMLLHEHPVNALPKDAGSVLAALGDEGLALAVVDASREAQLRERRTALERDWFGPLLAALKSGRIGMLTLQLCGADSLLEVETVRSDLRYFWRRRK